MNPPEKPILIQRGFPYELNSKFFEKKYINFQKTKLILNTIFYREINKYTFVGITRKKLLIKPSRKSDIITKGGPYELN